MSTRHFTNAVLIAAGILIWMTATGANAQATWLPAGYINSYALRDDVGSADLDPSIATDNAGTWLAMWQSTTSSRNTLQTDIEFARSTDGGITWDESSYLNLNQVVPPEYDSVEAVHSKKLVYAGNETWVCALLLYDPFEFTTALYVSTSIDNGHTWATAERLWLTEPNLNFYTFSLESNGTGNVIALWQSQDPVSNEIKSLIVRSSDNGQSWSTPEHIPVTEEIPGSLFELKLANVDDDRWVLAFTIINYINDDPKKDAYVATSLNNGETWNLSGLLKSERGPGSLQLGISANDDAVVISHYGLVRLFVGDYNAKRTINVSVSTDGGTTFAEAMELADHAAYSVSPGNPVAVETSGTWLLTYGTKNMLGNVKAWMSDDPATTWTETQLYAATEGSQDGVPVVVGGNNGNFVGVYEHRYYGLPVELYDSDIMSINSLDSGATWSIPAYVNADATEDTGKIEDEFASLASGDGTVLAAWGSNGTPSLLMYSRSEDNGRTWSEAQLLARNDSGADIVYVGSGHWIMRHGTDPTTLSSSDDGLSWTPLAPVDGNVESDKNGTLIRWGGSANARSVDYGETWQPNTGLDGVTLKFMTHIGGSHWAAVDESSAVFTSADGGATWTPHGVNDNLQSVTLNTITSDHNGTVMALGSRSYAPSKVDQTIESYILFSYDNGVSWSAPVLAHTEHPVIDSETYYASMSVRLESLYLGSGKWHVYMLYTLYTESGPFFIGARRDQTLYRFVSTDGALTWSTPEQIDVTATFTGLDDWSQNNFALKADILAAGPDVIFAWPGSIPDGDYVPTKDDERDILYRIYTESPPRNAASDWQLFE